MRQPKVDADSLAGDQWTVRTAREHPSFQQAAPWADYWMCEQALDAALQVIETPGKRRRAR